MQNPRYHSQFNWQAPFVNHPVPSALQPVQDLGPSVQQHPSEDVRSHRPPQFHYYQPPHLSHSHQDIDDEELPAPGSHQFYQYQPPCDALAPRQLPPPPPQFHVRQAPIIPTPSAASSATASLTPPSNAQRPAPEISEAETLKEALKGGAGGQRVLFTGHQLFTLVRAANDINIFSAAKRQKGQREQAFVDRCHAAGLSGSNKLLLTRLQECIKWQSDPDCPSIAHIAKAIDLSGLEDSFGAPLDSLSESQIRSTTRTETEKEKQQKKADEDKIGGAAIRAAALARSRKTQNDAAAGSDNDVSPARDCSSPTPTPESGTAPMHSRASSPVCASSHWRCRCTYYSFHEIA
ncbi:hypothetical protein CPB85DRAFT_192764 [Mucidula mucida]|nr:hypothetical protein CPB85DRAFT_192764 [Mucidula mucida]